MWKRGGSFLVNFSRKHLDKAERFLEAAQHDFRDGFFDTAISHAYYAMHHAARALLLLIGESPKTHSGVINVLWKNIGKLESIDQDDVEAISRAFNRRIEVDYGVEFEIPSREVCEEIIQHAVDFVSKSRGEIKKAEKGRSHSV
jgi:hypothetical protein